MPQSLDVKHVSDGPAPSAFPNGCHVCEVEIDPDTGVIEVVKYTSVNDFGTVINPLLVEGQLHGGVVQGIGQALMEHDGLRRGRPAADRLVHGLRDAARATTRRTSRCVSHPVPAKTNPLGVKGCGEAGCAGSLTSVMNAVVDALSEYGIRHHRHAGDAVPGLAGDQGGERAAASHLPLKGSTACAADPHPDPPPSGGGSAPRSRHRRRMTRKANNNK